VIVMATEKQTDANRLNARKSTGPRSEQGKASASRNAMRFGLFTRQLLLPGEDMEAFERLRTGLYAQLQPVGELERLYVERLFASAWRLRRTLAAEGRILARWHQHHRDLRSVPDLMSEQKPAEDLERVQKHAAALERSMDKTLESLKRLQENRPEEQTAIDENEPNSEEASDVTEASARIEIVKTNPIPTGVKEETTEETANCENEPNLGSSAATSALDPTCGLGGGAVHAPTPDVT
jgi:hypothetical protein